MIVVADTSVILNLCRVQHESLLQQLYERVLIPAPVAGEFTRLSKTQSRFSGLALPAGIEILPAPKTLPPEVIQAQLDAGEAAAIALCLEQNADALLVDELFGREVAARLRIRTVGVFWDFNGCPPSETYSKRESPVGPLGKRGEFLDLARIANPNSATHWRINSCSSTK